MPFRMMRAALASLVQAIWHALPLAFWLTIESATLYRYFADSPRKRKPQRQQMLDLFHTSREVVLC